MYLEKLTNQIHEVMNERGITAPNWRIKITDKEILGQSDWAMVTVEVYAPRKRKPAVVWVLAINFVRNIINWEKSSHYKP